MEAHKLEEQHSPQISLVPKQVGWSYIVSRNFDWIYFIASPILAVLVGSFIGAKHLVLNKELGKHSIFMQDNVIDVCFFTFTMAHPIVTFFRSHLRSEIFREYKWRFTIVPIALYIGAVTSNWFFSAFTILVATWDIYHCSLQTFGLGRIYDVKAGNDANMGRRLDFWFNIMIYTAPLFAGGVFLDHYSDIKQHWTVLFNGAPPAYHKEYGVYARNILIPTYLVFIGYYLYAHWKLKEKGYKVSMPKVYLYSITALVAVWANMFHSYGNSIAIMNFFHGVQYYAIVYAMEKSNLASLMGIPKESKMIKPTALLLILVVSVGYGLMVNLKVTSAIYWIAAFQVVSFLHFWYDGFIWSVRKKQV